MSMISKLCDDLRKAADEEGYCPNRYIELMRNAADTIEALSAKVREQNQTHDKRTETHGVCSEQVAGKLKNVENTCVSEDCERAKENKSKLDSDIISRQAVKEQTCMFFGHEVIFANKIDLIPSADRPTGKWTTEQVAEMLANLFGDECACNYNDNDEWLPSACKYADTQCPDPKEKHGCWMQFLIQGGGWNR